MKILVIEDSEPLGRLYVEQLRNGRHDARWVSSEPDALAVAATFRPNVVVFDFHLGEADGARLARRVGKLDPARPVRLIGVSGDPATPAARRGLDAFLLKPFKAAQLLEAVRPRRKQA